MGEFWNMVGSECRAAANWYWGGFDGLMASLVVFVVMAQITDDMLSLIHI